MAASARGYQRGRLEDKKRPSLMDLDADALRDRDVRSPSLPVHVPPNLPHSVPAD